MGSLSVARSKEGKRSGSALHRRVELSELGLTLTNGSPAALNTMDGASGTALGTP